MCFWIIYRIVLKSFIHIAWERHVRLFWRTKSVFCLMQRILSDLLPISGGCYSSELCFGAKNKSDASQNHLVKIFDNFSIHVHNIQNNLTLRLMRYKVVTFFWFSYPKIGFVAFLFLHPKVFLFTIKMPLPTSRWFLSSIRETNITEMTMDQDVYFGLVLCC